MDYFAHETAVIDEGAKIGKGTKDGALGTGTLAELRRISPQKPFTMFSSGRLWCLQIL